jgi:hypothetical protein
MSRADSEGAVPDCARILPYAGKTAPVRVTPSGPAIQIAWIGESRVFARTGVLAENLGNSPRPGGAGCGFNLGSESPIERVRSLCT